MRRATMAEVRATYKPRDSWWTVLLVDPIAGPLVRLVSPYRFLTPNRLTAISFVLGLAAAAWFLQAGTAGLVAGALLYHLSFVVDCVDGKIARLRGDGTIFGSWLDFIGDRIRVVLCAVTLMGGQFRETGRPAFLWLAVLIVFLALFRYVNSAQIAAIEAAMRQRSAAAGAPRVAVDEDGENAGMQELRDRFGPLLAARDWLTRRRIRGHLVSGIEFEMAVFVVAPLVAAATTSTALIWITVVTGALLLAMEALFVYRLWLAARTATRALQPL